MPRYGPGQSGPAPPRRRRPPKPAVPRGANAHAHAGGGGLAPVSAPKRHTPAQGGAVLRRGTFQPENRRQQSELAQSSRREGLRVAYIRSSERQKTAREKGDQQAYARESRRLRRLQTHMLAAGFTPHRDPLSTAYGAVQKAEKVPVAGELLSMVDPVKIAKTVAAAPGVAKANVESIIHPAKAKPMSRAAAEQAFKKGAASPSIGIVPWGKGARAEAPKPMGEAALEVKRLEGAPPPVPTGHTRLYRGERAPGKEAPPGTPAATHGRWYTDHEQHARGYAGHHRGEKGSVYYIDVPAGKARAWETGAGKRMSDNKRAAEHLVPESVILKPPAVPQEDVAAAKVRESLGPARARRAAQEGLYREERGKRIGRAQSASERAGGGEAGFAAAKGELRGELPKVKFQHLREGTLSQGEFENLLTTVQNHRDLNYWEKIHAQQGLVDAFREGRTPQRSQIKHLQTVFGDDAAKEIVKTSRLVKAGKVTMGVLNIPRSLMASFDLSAPFRQGLVAGVSHPGMFFKNFVPMVKSAGSENFYRAMMDSIERRPNVDLYHESGLKLTDLSKDAGQREEQFPTEYAEKLNVPVGGGHSVGPGHVVRASARAYTGFLNKMRADMFDHLIEVARKKGENVEDRKFQRALSSYINSATGRGSLGPAEHMGPALNTFFFSPRLMASRINFLDPTWYARKSGIGESPFVRRQALKSAGKLAAFGGGVGLAGAAAGGKIGYDPRSSDFGKAKFGNTRLDPLGGFSQYAVAASRIASGESISSTTGKATKLAPGFGHITRKDIVERFFAGKATPTVSFVYDLLNGTDFQGQPLDIKNEMLNRVIPLAIQDAYSLEQDTKKIPLGVAGYAAAGLGIGLQTYSGKQYVNQKIAKTKQNHADYGQKIVEGAIKTGLLPKGAHLPPEMEKALRIRTARYVNREKLGATDTRSRFAADMTFLEQRKLVGKAEGNRAIKWAKNEKRDYLVEKEMRHLSDWYFDDLYGNTLAQARHDLRNKGYDLPRLP